MLVCPVAARAQQPGRTYPLAIVNRALPVEAMTAPGKPTLFRRFLR
jgi:hypothetical protein